MDGATVAVDVLERAGVTHAFGVVGTTILNVLDRMDRGDVTYVSTRHEQVAASMATGYALATREPTVSISHVGPGAANQVLGVAAAYRDNVPVISITGNEPSTILGNDVNHEWDVTGVYDRFTKHSVQTTTSQFGREVRIAVVRSVTGMPGPVHIDIPIDVADADVAEPTDRNRRQLRERDMRATPTRAQPSTDAIERTRDILERADRPLIIAGSEIRWVDGADKLQRLAELLEVPVATTKSARGAFPESQDRSLGPVAHGTIDVGNAYFSSADLVIGIGVRFSDLTTDEWTLIDDGATVIHATLRANELDRHYVADVSALADPASFCTALVDEMDGTELSFETVTSDVCESYDRVRRDLLEPTGGDDGVDPRTVVAAVVDTCDKFAYTTGGGVHNTFPRLLPVNDLRGYFGTRNFTGMSQGFPLAMGAQLALDRPVVTFEGDGGFAMVMQDLETAVREDIPVKIIIFNNDAYMSHAVRQDKNYGGRYVGTKYANPAFDAVAEEFGLFSERVESDAAVADAVERLFEADGPGLLDVQVDSTIGT